MYKKIKNIFLVAVAVITLSGCVAHQVSTTTLQQIEDEAVAEQIVAEEPIVQETFGAKVEDAQDLLTEEQEELLYSFALKYAQTLKEMQSADFRELFENPECEDSYLNSTAYMVLTEIRSLNDKDLTLEDAQVTYRVQSVANYGSYIYVEVFEDNVQKFRHLSEESLTCNTYHTFKLVNTDEGWKIREHLQEEDFFLLAQSAWEDAKGADYTEKMQNAIDLLIADAKENCELSVQYPNEYVQVAVNKEYDREKALEYAAEWFDKRNSEYLEYDLYGGNCQNFASQCIYAGGMDMDIKGSFVCQWKFYGKDLNLSQTAAGRSYSWIGVDEFYTYAVNNKSTGLITQTNIDLKYAQKGDVIQVGAYNKWHHSLLVTDVLFDADGQLAEVVLCSNTADRWNYPLSAYIYTYPRLIHIDGQI